MRFVKATLVIKNGSARAATNGKNSETNQVGFYSVYSVFSESRPKNVKNRCTRKQHEGIVVAGDRGFFFTCR